MAKTESLTIYVYNKPVELTAETIDKTWKWFSDHCRLCAADAIAGKFFVNDLKRYVEREHAEAARYDRHEGVMSVTFIQRAYYIQSGESVPLLA